jgi:hypothetical protein
MLWIFDEDSMHRSLVRALRARGVDVITALDAGMIERADAVLFSRGAERNESVDALRAWLHRAETVVKLMLKGKSQLLELDVV